MSKKTTKATKKVLLPLGLCLLLSSAATAAPPNPAPVPQAQTSPGPMDAMSQLCYGGKGSDAIEACQQLAAQINERPGQYDEKAFINSRLRDLLYGQGRYREAVEAATRALAAVEKWKGPNSGEAWVAVTMLGNSLVKAGAFEEAEKQQRRAVKQQQEAKPQDPALLATSQNTLAAVLGQRGKLEEAEQLLRLALATTEAALGKDHSGVASSQHNLAAVLSQRGKLEEAEQLLRHALATTEATLSKDHPEVASSQNDLAAVLYQRGKLQEAEQLLRLALATRGAALGKDHPDIAQSKGNLASVLSQRGKLDEAEQLHRHALATLESALGKDHPVAARSQHNLAEVLRQRGKLEEAEQLHRRALATLEAALGKDHPEVAQSQNNLGWVLFQRGKAEEAEQLFRGALATTEAALGKNHPEVALSQTNLAGVLFQRGKLKEVEQLLRRALATREAAQGKDHPEVAPIQSNLAWLELQRGRLELALDWLSKAVAIEEQAIQRSPTEAYADGLLHSFLAGPMTIYGLSLQSRQSEATQLAMQVALLNKSRTQHVGTLVRRALQSRLQTGSQKLRYEQMTQKLLERAKLLDEVGGSEKKEREKKLLWEAQQIEQELSQELGIRSSQRMPGLTEILGAVKAKLQLSKDSALVEVVIGTTWDYKRSKDWDAPVESHYMALTLYPDGTMQAVDMGKVAEVHAVVWPMYQALSGPQGNARAAGKAVHQKVFAKLESALQKRQVKRLIVSGDLMLNLIPWGAVHDKQGYWADRYAIQYVSAGRDLLRPAAEVKSEAAVVLADPEPSSRKLGAARAVSEALARQLGVHPLLDREATEANLLRSSNPFTLLLATHGLYRAAPPEQTSPATVPPPSAGTLLTMNMLGNMGFRSKVPMQSAVADLNNVDESMHRSALEMAPGKNSQLAEEDGMLTAEEVQKLRLLGTQLVTMLACEGGIGALGVGQGVYGLRRAFEQAGAETVVSTLWKVDEPSAAKLIQSYYNKLLKEKKRRVEAMEEAMRELRADKDHPEYQHPYYWAPFVVTGLDGPLRIPAQAAGK